MSKERLEELLDDLPYSIRHSGELEPLKQFAREQAERVSKQETRINNLTFDLAVSRAQNKRYRGVLEEIARGRFPGASYKARKALEGEE